MNVHRAKTAGFCMGVSLALQKLNTALERRLGQGMGQSTDQSTGQGMGQGMGQSTGAGRICTLGPIIHNPQVLAEYEARGVVCVKDPAQLQQDDVAVIRAHGITRQVEQAVYASGATVVDATCPKVKKAQLAIARATSQGASLLLFGEEDHPEVRGLISYARGPAHVLGNAAELAALPLDPAQPYVLASQTTQDREIFTSIHTSLGRSLSNLTVLSTICDATRERQEEARNIASSVDVMVIVGGRQSGNTRRLADVAALSGITTYHVESAEELEPKNFADKPRVGLTAGASTPKSLIDAAEQWLSSL